MSRPAHGLARRPVVALQRLAVALLLVAAFGLAFVLTPPRGARSLRQFDPDRIASLETRLWQAEDATHRGRRFGLQVILLREQYHFSWATAAVEGFHLTRAAARFGDLGDRSDAVLPDLEAAYGKVRAWTGSSFDAGAVARAEIAWWDERRRPRRNGPEQMGQLIAEEYALLYESSPPAMAAAALLRAQAAALHDARAARPDWEAIARLLRESYRELRLALATANV
jgi:hypothetical protein